MPYGTKSVPEREFYLRQTAYAPNLSNYTVTGSDSPLFYRQGTRAGEANPRFREIIRKRGDATTAFTASRWDYSLGRQTHEWDVLDAAGNITVKERMYNPILYSCPWNSASPPTPSQVTTADNKAKAYFNKRAKAAITSTQGLVFVGQLKQTARMITTPANGLIQAMAKYINIAKTKTGWRPPGDRRFTARERKRVLKNVNQVYLEATYGWAPLVNDVKSAAEALARMCINAPVYKVTSMGRAEDVQFLSDTWNGLIRNFEFEQWVEVWYRGAIKQSFNQKELDKWNLLGVNFAETLPAAWELLPWSFVYDYFGNIGDILEAASTPLHLFQYIVRTERQFGERRVVLRLPPDTWKPGFVGMRATKAPAEQAYSRFTKVIRSKALTTFPTPELQMPSLRQGFNLASLGLQAALGGSQNFRSVSR